MTLDLCVEASGSVAHLIGTDTLHSLFLRHPFRLSAARRARSGLAAGDGDRRGSSIPGPVDPARLSAALDRLPLLLVHVLWLVDVCRCSYDTAAAELGRSPQWVADRVAEARHQLRIELLRTEPLDDDVSVRRRGSAGSTSPSPPGWPPPGR